ncbi:hypothetical protein AZZ99_003249 [Serratia marcescens]|nr:hypothetical protein AZZ99_003249 [Serratia marcescens]
MMHLNYLKLYSGTCLMKLFRQINGTDNEQLKILIVQQKYWQKYVACSLTTSYLMVIFVIISSISFPKMY